MYETIGQGHDDKQGLWSYKGKTRDTLRHHDFDLMVACIAAASNMCPSTSLSLASFPLVLHIGLSVHGNAVDDLLVAMCVHDLYN